MDQWGPDGCREHRAEIVRWLEEGAAAWGWLAALAAKAMPLGKVIDKAIANCEAAVIQVHLNDGGIGDHLIALMCARALQCDNQSRDVILVGREDRLAWLRPFAGSIYLEAHHVQGVKTIELNVNIYDILRRAHEPRWEYWGRQVGIKPKPCDVTLSDDARAWAARFAGCVALVPFAAHAARTWSMASWVELERLLTERGYRCVIVDEWCGRSQDLNSEKVEGERPERVIALLRGAALVIGNDSGMAHVAGNLLTPTVALSSFSSDERIFDIYPTVKNLGGRTGGGFAAIKPEDVLRVAEEFGNQAIREAVAVPELEVQRHCPAERGHLFSGWDSYSVEVETGELLAGLIRSFKPEYVLETGTYHGRSTEILADAIRRNGIGQIISLECCHDCFSQASRQLRDRPEVHLVCVDSLAWLREYNGPKFGFVFLDSDRHTRVEELKLIRDRSLALGPVLVHDTSRRRGEAGYTDDLDFPTALDAVGLPSLENPFARGWRLFNLSDLVVTQ